MARKEEILYASLQVVVGSDGIALKPVMQGRIGGSDNGIKVELGIGAKEQTFFQTCDLGEIQMRFVSSGFKGLLENRAVKGTKNAGVGSVKTPDGKDFVVMWRRVNLGV